MSPDPPPAGFVGVVLAGGTGERLGGVDKAGLSTEGRTFLSIAIDALADADAVVVVGPHRSDTPRPVTFIREEPPLGGPAAGLLAGVDALERGSGMVAVLAVDMPRASRRTFRRLLEAALGRDGAVLVDAGGRRQLCCVLDLEALGASAPRDRHGLPMHRLLDGLDLVEVAGAAESLDVDVWGDLRGLDS